jgi:2-phospho-L-lactate transferase/gluconeogenesis factor (CofD/UPF0052 family)
MINIVSFNGGRGAKTLISGFLKKEGIYYTSIVNAYDDGKSTGNIRSFFRMLGPSDIRKVQEAMIPRDLEDYDGILQLFNFRYDEKADHEKILGGLGLFAERKTDELAGVILKDEIIRESLRVLVQYLLRGITLIEKAENKKINLDDCSIMNLLYAGAFLYCSGDFEDATIFFDKLFKLQGTVLPTNNEDKKLVALREDGTILYSEAEIVELRSNSRIKKIYLLDQYPDRELVSEMDIREAEAYFETMNRQVSITPRVERSISDADIIIYSAGTQHSSLYPSYMTHGITDAIAANKKALKVFITNIGEDYETPSYTASDFINGTVRYLKMGTQYNISVSDVISIALVNNSFSNKKMENYVQLDMPVLVKIGCRIIADTFEDIKNPGKHDGAVLADFIVNKYYQHLKSSVQ